MLFKRKLPKTKRTKINDLERAVLNYIINALDSKHKDIVTEQIKYLTHLKRLNYKSSCSTEFYPEKFGIIPKALLFQRQEEFLLSKLTLLTEKFELKCKVHVALGQIFEINTVPSIKTGKIKLDKIKLYQIWINNNLDKNELETTPNT